jgi:NAD(P)-dependent dehydrogenase (short-subunit alcohol dehydrogenase family)
MIGPAITAVCQRVQPAGGRGGGRVSSAAFAGTAGLAAANGALEAMAAPLAVELASVRVNAVSPGVAGTAWWHGRPAEQRQAYFGAVAAVTPAR